MAYSSNSGMSYYLQYDWKSSNGAMFGILLRKRSHMARNIELMQLEDNLTSARPSSPNCHILCVKASVSTSKNHIGVSYISFDCSASHQ